MKNDETKRWLSYQEQGQKPTRFKLSAVVYSDQAFEKSIHFKLNNYEMTLSPLSPRQAASDIGTGMMPAFLCETIADAKSHRGGNNFDLSECLDRVMPVFGFRYAISMHFDQWEEYDGEWIKVIAGGGSISMQTTYLDIPKPHIHSLVQAYEKLSLNKDKRSIKAVKIRQRLKEALDLEEISPRFSFMSFYNIIEIISDDLALNKHVTFKQALNIEQTSNEAITNQKQRKKIHYLLSAFKNDFDINEQGRLAEIRNKLAHGKFEFNRSDVERCKRLAFWASENYVIHLST